MTRGRWHVDAAKPIKHQIGSKSPVKKQPSLCACLYVYMYAVHPLSLLQTHTHTASPARDDYQIKCSPAWKKLPRCRPLLLRALSIEAFVRHQHVLSTAFTASQLARAIKSSQRFYDKDHTYV